LGWAPAKRFARVPLSSFCRETGETDYAKAGIADGYGRFVSVITMNGNQKCPLEAAPMGWFFLLAMDGRDRSKIDRI
jgi:hypothetical protein